MQRVEKSERQSAEHSQAHVVGKKKKKTKKKKKKQRWAFPRTRSDLSASAAGVQLPARKVAGHVIARAGRARALEPGHRFRGPDPSAPRVRGSGPASCSTRAHPFSRMCGTRCLRTSSSTHTVYLFSTLGYVNL